MLTDQAASFRARTVPERLEAGDALTAAWLSLDSPVGAEAVAGQGFDVAVLDMQHGLTHAGNLPSMLQAVQGAGVHALVRTSANEPALVTRALDLGADGVIVPLVNDAAEAAAAVAPCRYPPAGTRSYGPLRAAQRFGSAAEAERAQAVFVMVETRRALERVDEIAATPGLTGIFVGPADLGYGMGLGPQTDSHHPEHRAALETILAACRKHGVAAGIYSHDPGYVREWVGRGMQLVVIANDASLLRDAAATRVAAWRNEPERPS